jgi:hypothetical protein
MCGRPVHHDIAFNAIKPSRVDELPQWLTVAETAAYLKVTTWFVYQVPRGRPVPDGEGWADRITRLRLTRP